MTKTTAAFILTTTLLAGAAFAQPGGSVRQACAADLQKFCSSVQPGGGGMMKCMHQHSSDLSDECKSAWAARRASRQETHADQNAAQPQ